MQAEHGGGGHSEGGERKKKSSGISPSHTHTHTLTEKQGGGGAVQRGVSQRSMRALLACDAAKRIDRMQIETIDRNNNKGFTHSRIWT